MQLALRCEAGLLCSSCDISSHFPQKDIVSAFTRPTYFLENDRLGFTLVPLTT